ncbi:MAG: hypothetical protein ACYDHY_04115 [Acidiferrobacterales bacterium]
MATAVPERQSCDPVFNPGDSWRGKKKRRPFGRLRGMDHYFPVLPCTGVILVQKTSSVASLSLATVSLPYGTTIILAGEKARETPLMKVHSYSLFYMKQ